MRNKWLKVGIVAVAALMALTLAIPALAQDATPTPETPSLKGWGRGFGFMGRGSWETFDAQAEALGMTPEQLFAELHAGKTIDEIATEKGIDLQKVYDAVKAAQVEAQKAAIEQAVTDGNLTREQADWLLQGLELGYMPMGRGHGRGFGFGGRGCPGSSTPSTTTSARAGSSF